MKKAVFLDRDGTIIEDRGYLADPDGVKILPGVVNALRALRDAGYLLIIVSNQSGLARGFFDYGALESVDERLRCLFGEAGIEFAAVGYCPHGPDDSCDCRKPAPGMLLRFAAEFDVDPGLSVMIGDKLSDAEAGLAAACRVVYLLGSAERHRDLPSGVVLCSDLSAAVEHLLSLSVEFSYGGMK